MFPKLEKAAFMSKKEFLVSSLQSEEYVRNLIAKAQNKNYKPWQNHNVEKKHLSPFGEFPPRSFRHIKDKSMEIMLTPDKNDKKMNSCKNTLIIALNEYIYIYILFINYYIK